MNEFREGLQRIIPMWIDIIKLANAAENDIEKDTKTLSLRIAVAILREGDVYTEYEKAKKYSEGSVEALDALSEREMIDDGFYLQEMNSIKEFREVVDGMWRHYLILSLDENKGKEGKE